MENISKTSFALFILLISVFIFFCSSQIINAASPTIEISNVRVQGDPISAPACGSFMALGPGIVLDMDITATDTDLSDIVELKVLFSPPTIETVSFNPLTPVNGNPVSTHLHYFGTQIFYMGIMSIIAKDLDGNTTQCDIFIDFPLPSAIPYIVISNAVKNGVPLSNPICGSTIQAVEGDVIDFDVVGVFHSDFILTQEFTPGPSPIPGATFTPSLPANGNSILISHFHLEPQYTYLGNLKLVITRDGGLTYECIINFDLVLPVELNSFVSIVNGNDITLNWTTESENNNALFEIERANGNSENWNNIGSIQGSGTTSSHTSYSFTDRGINSGSYSYRLKQIDFNGNFEYHNLSNEVVIGPPVKFELSQNYPNPFNPFTKIDFEIPEDGTVNITVYDNSGKEVSDLVNGYRTAGYYSVQFNASDLSSGIYYYKIQFSGNRSFQKVMKMALVK